MSTRLYRLIVHSSISIRIGFSEVFVFTLGDESWRVIGDVPYGCLHWVGITRAELIALVDVVDQVFRVIPHPECGPEVGCYYLGVLSGCLSFTFFV
ncbi:hypothetical protein ACSBR2_011990 [Camellia fascicularis]